MECRAFRARPVFGEYAAAVGPLSLTDFAGSAAWLFALIADILGQVPRGFTTQQGQRSSAEIEREMVAGLDYMSLNGFETWSVTMRAASIPIAMG